MDGREVRARKPATKPKARVIGVCGIPYCPDLYAVEVMVPSPPHAVDFTQFWPYRPPAWDTVWDAGSAHFYLSEDGEELIGSYLGRKAYDDEDDKIYGLDFFRRSRSGTTRAVLLMDDVYPDFQTCWGRLRLPRLVTALPERLLRLIWVEDGQPGQGEEQAYLADI
jgi:hypothetical protein